MPLFAKNFQELMTESISDLAQNTSITRLSPGGFARAFLESVNKRIAEAYDLFDLNLARAFVSSAPGQYLELIGTLLGVHREVSAAAEVDDTSRIVKFYVATGTFGDINNGNNIIIPQDTLISTDPNNGGITYRTVAEYTLLSSQSVAYIAAEATLPGETSNVGSNSLRYHDFSSYADSINNTLLVTNIHPIANGRDLETDENYRFRIVNKVLEAEAANFTAIRLAILTTPGVADVVLIPRYKGIGTVGAILKATLPTVSDSLISAVQSNVEKVQAIGDLAYIRKPKETGISMKITVHYSQRLPEDELDNIENTITSTITSFVNDLDIGEQLIVNRMISQLFAIDTNISNIGSAGKPIDELYVHKESALEDNRVRQVLLGDYSPARDERVIMEPTITNPITLARAYERR